MTRTCLLHIGMNKTGSTSIQRVFQHYRTPQLQFLDLGEANQSRMIALRFMEKPHDRFFSSADPEARIRERAEAVRLLDARLAAAPGDVILSGEALSAFRPPDCRSVLAGLGQSFDRVRVLAYVRDPLGFITSALQQRLKTNLPHEDFADFYPGYQNRLGRWRRALPKGDLTLALFHREAFRDGELLVDFAHRAGVPEAWARARLGEGRANPSLSAEATAALLRFRRVAGRAPLHGPGRAANIQLVDAMQGFGRTPFALDPAVLAPILAERAEDIAWIERQLGRPFPAPRPKAGAAVFDSFAGLAEFGAGLGPAFAAWQAEAFPRLRVTGGTVEEMMHGVLGQLTEAS